MRRKAPGATIAVASTDRFSTVRREAQKVLAIIQKEIRRAEGDLQKLLEQARIWEQAIAMGTSTGSAGTGKKRGRPAKGTVAEAAPRPARKPRAEGPRVDWDEVLRSVPEVFGMEDVLKHPGAAAKGRAQIYPAMNRWVQAQKIEKVDKGSYRRI